MSRLALLVPARNAESLIGRLFDSVDAQTTPFDEILVYDDASTDRTAEIAVSRGASVVPSSVNTGPSHGKNVLARTTTCEWVHFHDSDDALHPEFVAMARQWMSRDDADVVLFATEDRDHLTDQYLASTQWDDAALREDPVKVAVSRTITNCGLYRRASFIASGGFDTSPDVNFNEDQAMHLRLALAGVRFRADSLPGVVLYQRAGSMSSGNRIGCTRAQIEVLAKAVDHTGDKYAAEIGPRLWRLAGMCAGHSDWEYVERCLHLAARIRYRDPVEEHWGIRVMARASGLGAIAVREGLIRWLKPHLRVAMPSVERGSTLSREARPGVPIA